MRNTIRKVWTSRMRWQANLLVVMAFLVLPAILLAQYYDPMQLFGHQSASLAMPSATTTKIIPSPAAGGIYVGDYNIPCSGSATTIQFEYGHGTTCASTPVVLTGAMPCPAATPGGAGVIQDTTNATHFVAPAGNDICAIVTGAGANYAGHLTYVEPGR